MNTRWILCFTMLYFATHPTSGFSFSDLIHNSIDSIKSFLPWNAKRSSDISIVNTDKGLVKGFKMVSRSGKSYYAFTSIPYAKPPLGQYRFERPLPADSWKGVREGPADLPDCWQIQALNPFVNNVTYGTEDCLYLSVFTPEVDDSKKLPVMVYIHGGGFRSEYPNVRKAIRSRYFMDEEVVLVIIKYRIGAFGFLSLEDEILPGNMGLKDMALAITWVSKNIQVFGGDPSSVTLFGNDAGAASVHYLLTSPLTKDLIKAGISQSGTATCLWALGAPGVGRYRSSRLAQHLKCPLSNERDMIDCLKRKTAFEIADAERLFISQEFSPFVPYQPVIESGDGCVICDSPYNIPVEKPWILGLNNDEGAFRTVWYLVKPELQLSFIKDGVKLLPEDLMYTNTSSYERRLSQYILSKYADLSMTDMWTDGMFLNGLDAALRKVAVGPTFLYLFNHRGQTTVTEILSKEGGIGLGNLGVSHMDECLYLFNYEDDLKITKTPLDTKISKSLINMWTNFAKHGKPDLYIEWPQFDQLNQFYLHIHSIGLNIKPHLWRDRTDFWKNAPVRDIMEDFNL